MDFFEHQDRARKKTKLLVLYFILAVIFIVIALNLVAFLGLKFATREQQTLLFEQWFSHAAFYYVTCGTLAMVFLGSLFRWFQLREGGKSVAQMVNAREILPDSNDALERRFINVVEEMSIASGTPVPTLYVMDDEDAINAFVAGYDSSNTVMVVTRGALEQLDRQELQGVVAHEFSHIFNADMRINVKLISTLAGILLLGQAGSFIMRSLRYSRVRSSNNKDSGSIIMVILFIGMAMFIVGSIGLLFGRLIKAAISRQREFLADASAVQYARDNEGLAGAFLKIEQQSSLLQTKHAEDTSHMCIAEPIKLSLSGLATHPSMPDRLDAIMPNWQAFSHDFEQKEARKKKKAIQEKLDQQAKEKAAQEQASKKSNSPFSGLIDSVGHPTAMHLEAANALLLALPDVLKQAAHGHHAQAHAMHLVFALLLSDDGQLTEQSLRTIEQAYGDQSGEQVLKLAEHISKDKRHLRLAILDIAIPSIKRLSENERVQFFKALKTIIHQDETVTQFEYVLYSLLKKNLRPSSQKRGKAINNFKWVLPEIQLVLSAMVHASEQSQEHKQACFSKLWTSFSHDEKGLLKETFRAEKFHQAISRLNLLVPMLKKELLANLELAVTDDNELKPAEVELLRATAECLDCPIPPLLRSNQASA